MEFAMKKYILIFASMLLIFSLLAGCSKAPATGTIATEAPTAEQTIAATEASVPEQTTVPNETQAAEDIVHENDATAYYIEVAYADQIARYYTALSEKWDEVTYLENDMSSLPYYYYEGNPLENVGFGFVDLDNDAHCELVIGAILNAEQDASVFEIWTLVDGEPVMLAQGGSRNHYVLQYVEEDKMWYVAHEGSNSAYNFATYYLMLSEGKLEVVQGIVFNAAADEENPWFMSYDLDWDASNDEPIDEATANAILESQRKFYAALELIPYSSITP